jgi:hypothetical protein
MLAIIANLPIGVPYSISFKVNEALGVDSTGFID